MEVKLHVLEGKQKGREIPLPETIFLIGRDHQCHLRPHCELVSKLHCAIAAWAGRVRVRDLKSRNGTFLNGRPINGEVVVRDGDRLQVGTLVFAFRIKNAEGLPMPLPLKQGDVQWLLDSPGDSAVLSPTSETCFPEIPPDLSGDSAGTERGSKAISAGQHLRDYFEQRKRRRNSAAEQHPAQN
jgi:pSer/pThr/pTyr-binding forkhead associated (FHA) protein